MTTALQTIDPRQKQLMTLSTFLKKKKDFIAQTAGKHLNSERMVRLTIAAASSNSLLLQATPESVLLCLLDCARLGLEPTGPGGVWLVPFKNNRTDTVECTVITDYRGELALARRSGELRDISAHAVYEEDEFRLVYGDEEQLVHEPVLFGKKGAFVGCYAIARLKNGGMQRAFMSKAQVEERRQRSRAARNGPWVTDFEKMALKTVIREVLNLCPMAIEYREWVEREESRELVTRQPTIDITARIESEEPAPTEQAQAQRPRSARAAAMAGALKETQEPEDEPPMADAQDIVVEAQEAAQEAAEAEPPHEDPEPTSSEQAQPEEPGDDDFALPPEPDADRGLNELRGQMLALQKEVVEVFDGDAERAKRLWGKFLAVDLNKITTVGQGNSARTKARTVLKRAKLAMKLHGLFFDLGELDVRVPELPLEFERDWSVSRLEGTASDWARRLAEVKSDGGA